MLSAEESMSGQMADAYAAARKQTDRVKDLEELVEALTKRVVDLEIVVAYG